jgi:MoxR-like ATPase
VIPTREQQDLAREILRDLLKHTENASLPAAAEEASAGPLVRARRLLLSGQAVLASPPSGDGDDKHSWRLKLEGVAREIDAAFAAEDLPEELAALRTRIVEKIGPSGGAGL